MTTRPFPPGHLALAPIIALAWFVCAAVLVHLRRPELDPVHSQMSLYLIGPWGPVLQSAYIGLGAGMWWLAVALYRSATPHARSTAPLLMFAIGGLSLAITAIAWMDLPDMPATGQGLIHGLSAQAAFLCATTGLVLQAARLREDTRWQALRAWLLPWALGCFASVWVLALWRDAPRGLAQKAVIVLILGWLAVVAVHHWRLASTGRATHPPRR